MIPISRSIVGYLVTGINDDNTLKTDCLGHMVALDPETHTPLFVGLKLEATKRLQNYYFRDASGHYAKWNGFRRLDKGELVASYRQWLDRDNERAQGHYIHLDSGTGQ